MNLTINHSHSFAAPWNGPCIAVDRDGDRVRAIRATRLFQTITFTRIDWPDATPVNERTVVVACLQQCESIVRWISTPLSSARKARAVLPSLLDIQLPFRLEECRFLLPVFERQADGLVRGLAIVARDADIRQRLSELLSAAIDPHMLDQEGVALWTQSLLELPSHGATDEHPEAVRAVVYFGFNRVTLVIGQGQTIHSAHSLHSLKADHIGRLIRAAQANIGASGPATIQWFLCGPAAVDRQAIETFLHDVGSDLSGTMTIAKEPDLFLLRALAVRALACTVLPCNFRIGVYTSNAITRREIRESNLLAMASLAAGIFLIIVNILWRSALSASVDNVQFRLQSAAQVLIGHKAQKGMELLQSQRHLDTLARTSTPFARASGLSIPDALSRILAGAASNDIMLSRLTIGHGTLSARGSAPTWEACERFRNVVKPMGFPARLERIDETNTTRSSFLLKTGDVP